MHGGNVAEAEGAAKPQGRKGRVAGQDPVKRQQITEAAKRCFLELGFEATSMNDITAAAGVSKGTIYVYFADKEDLFTSLCKAEREQLMDFAQSELDASTTVTEALNRLGVALATRLTSDRVIKAQRMVLAVVERLPKLAASFFGPEPFSGPAVLKGYLEKKVATGELVVEDTELAARQLIDLVMAGLFKPRLFGNMVEPPSAELVAANVAKGVDVFLAYYGRK
jgi:AcrR family transcriptional regulator